jgi:hypothetical protein
MTGGNEIGNCRLCRAQGIHLAPGHVLPRWAHPPARQMVEHRHCGPCEAQLERDEAYVGRLAYTGERLGLLEHVLPGPGPRADLRMASLRGFNAPALARFAASVFWRGHVSSSPERAGLVLSAGQAEALRDYVRGARALPRQMCITLAALIEAEPGRGSPWTTTAFPRTEVAGEDGWHAFAAAGLAFGLSTGDGAAGIGGICLACGHDPHVVFTAWSRLRHVVTLADVLLTGVRKSRPVGIPGAGR